MRDWISEEEAAERWASSLELTNCDLVFRLLMKGPHTLKQLVAGSGLSVSEVNSYITMLRRGRHFWIHRRKIVSPGYKIELSGRGHGLCTNHLIQDHRKHPWMHLGTMDLLGTAPPQDYDDGKELFDN